MMNILVVHLFRTTCELHNTKLQKHLARLMKTAWVQTQLQKITTKMLGAAEIVHDMANWKLEVVEVL